ncbi:metal dependent phosphohydrolase [Candidatus Scalindua japonica]|uniref:Metal dependent phosphohydrolase n=1 Tax=Candidatus Scalindua japonica TaxID=1284222 RepID=A0A286TTM5_9BACT|nr:HD-GYP domain-containing protein [Candidatus Scalindua japonica]GAX59214.1 metal dependent phosphohydrolase [Candidatus Scalindua japonica]
MIMHIEYFQELFCGLTQISPLNFEVWNGDGPVFSSRFDGADTTISSQIEEFSDSVMSQGVFRHTSMNGWKAVFGVPIRNNEQTVGCLLAYSKNSNKNLIPDESAYAEIPDVKGVEMFLTRLVSFIEDKWEGEQEKEKITEELGRSFEDLYLYSQVANQIKTLLSSNQMNNDLVLDTMKTMRVDISFVNLFNHEGSKIAFNEDSLYLQFSGIAEKFVGKLIRTLTVQEKVEKRTHFTIHDSRTDSQFSKLFIAQYRLLAVKITHDNKFYGWLGLISFNLKESFRRSELRLLISMAEQLAMLITNTDLYKELEGFVINLIKSMVCAIEAKDVYTSGHSERVSELCLNMAEYMDLTEDDKKNLKWAAILHDVGKIGVPESILCKEGPLEDDEYRKIKEHPKRGFEILKHIKQLVPITPSILHHHERYDGKGYPDGLKGDEIPLYARIIAIIDTYDAITSRRSYRSAKSSEEAMSIIEKVAGTQLDPNLVLIFKEVYRDSIVVKKDEQISGKEKARWQCQQLT